MISIQSRNISRSISINIKQSNIKDRATLTLYMHNHRGIVKWYIIIIIVYVRTVNFINIFYTIYYLFSSQRFFSKLMLYIIFIIILYTCRLSIVHGTFK